MRKGLTKKDEGGAWQELGTIHQHLNEDDGNNKSSLKRKGQVAFFLSDFFSF